MRLVLDAEAIAALADQRHPARRLVLAQLEIAARLGREVCAAEVTLAELYRGPQRSAALDAALARLGDGLTTRSTDRSLARAVGSLLHAAGVGSALLADAHAVALAVETDGVVLTSDPDDLGTLAAGHPRVVIRALRG